LNGVVDQPYYFRPGDRLIFKAERGGNFFCSLTENIQIPGLWLFVKNTNNTAVNDTTRLRTFDRHGLEPSVGSFYYASYRYVKPDADFDTKLFTTHTQSFVNTVILA
jgi:hypothetical protein